MAQAGFGMPPVPPGIPGFPPTLPQAAGFPPMPAMPMFNPHAMQAMAGAFQAMNSGVATSVANQGKHILSTSSLLLLPYFSV